ncbi:MAG TPA: PadR family transcriptional regulator [Desulfomonilia bacterium]|nr:PadR family transcriptional regulator [Desulfomonilia bacterium]
METDQVILGLLMSGPKSGYKIKNITGKLMMAYNLSLNQIYPALRKLEAGDLVKKDVVIQTGKPNMHVYALTDMGKEIFLKSLTAPPVPIDYQLDFLTRAFFFRFLPEEEIFQQFDQEISSLEEQLADLEQIRAEVEDRSDDDGLFIYSTIVGMIQMLKERYISELKRRREGHCNKR